MPNLVPVGVEIGGERLARESQTRPVVGGNTSPICADQKFVGVEVITAHRWSDLFQAGAKTLEIEGASAVAKYVEKTFLQPFERIEYLYPPTSRVPSNIRSDTCCLNSCWTWDGVA